MTVLDRLHFQLQVADGNFTPNLVNGTLVCQGEGTITIGRKDGIAEMLRVEKATVEYRCDRPEAPLMIYRNGKGRGVKVKAGDGYQHEMAYLAKCIRTVTPPEVVTAAQAADSIRLVEAEEKSVLTGKRVRV